MGIFGMEMLKVKIIFREKFCQPTIMDESLGSFCVSGAFSNAHSSNPFPHPTNNVGCVYQASTLYRVAGGRTARKFRKGYTVLRGNQEMTEKYEYCSTVPRAFVQDCRLILNFLCLLALYPISRRWKLIVLASDLLVNYESYTWQRTLHTTEQFTQCHFICLGQYTSVIRVVTSSQLPAKIATYLVSIGRLLC